MDTIEESSLETSKKLSMKGIKCKCKCVDVYDGDTITIVFPFSNELYNHKFRLYGIDTAEIRRKKGTSKEEIKVAKMAKKWLENKILNKCIWIDFKKEDKYGRLMGNIFIYNDTIINSLSESMSSESMSSESISMSSESISMSINDELIQEGMAYKYLGKKKKKFEEWYLKE